MAKLGKNFKVNLGKQAVKNVVQQAVQQSVGRAIEKDPRIVENQTKYQKNGLTFQSNNNSVVPRDQAGNIKLQESATDNPLLIVEAASTKILNNSVLKVIDTQFNYFKFPATTRIVDTDDVDIDLDLDLTVEQESEDVIYARYKPSENRKILSDLTGQGIPSGILIDELEEGQIQKRPNNYYITKQIKESGADLRFRVKINFRYDSDASDFNTTYFYISRSGPDKYLQRDYIQYFEFDDPYAGGGKISQYQVQNAYKDVVIVNSEFEVGDTFSITALAGINDPNKYSTINATQTYWSITDASKNVDEWNREI
tara:strand:+ start:946 stop:1881 length:936 start_codon:yes stop_codon:yes gene_type:complete